MSTPVPPVSPRPCGCLGCRMRHITGPIMLITVGVLLALQTVWHRASFGHTWPVILIVLGVLKVMQYFTPHRP